MPNRIGQSLDGSFKSERILGAVGKMGNWPQPIFFIGHPSLVGCSIAAAPGACRIGQVLAEQTWAERGHLLRPGSRSRDAAGIAGGQNSEHPAHSLSTWKSLPHGQPDVVLLAQ